MPKELGYVREGRTTKQGCDGALSTTAIVVVTTAIVVVIIAIIGCWRWCWSTGGRIICNWGP